MSRKEATVHTNTRVSLQAVGQWLDSQDGWTAMPNVEGSHRQVCRTDDGVVSVTLIDLGNHKPGTASASTKYLGSPCTIFFDMAIRRDSQIVGRLDDFYQVVFGLMQNDPCDLRFTLDDENFGVLLRRNGRLLVNPGEFQALSLANLLEQPFEVVGNELFES